MFKLKYNLVEKIKRYFPFLSSKTFVGYDLNKNMYFESKKERTGTKFFIRSVVYSEKGNDIDLISKIPVEYNAWLRHTRNKGKFKI